ncbi:MAG: tRNA (cytidine(34)-2'-O)-methyltransferase [Planctomycetia bacterium]|nr:tRNA (cytidine(34)-2'-O)-methyltransferase [Planctomycetia bacterium]
MRYDPLLHIVLHEPEIPPNAGNVGRTCVAIGAKMWLVRPIGFKLDDYYLRRAGLDYWEELEWEVADSWDDLVSRLAQVGRRPNWFFEVGGPRTYTDVTYSRGDVLVFGSESKGLPEDLLAAHTSEHLTIPSRPQVRSLNLSNCAAIVAYEAVRQWGGLGPRP